VIKIVYAIYFFIPFFYFMKSRLINNEIIKVNLHFIYDSLERVFYLSTVKIIAFLVVFIALELF